MAWSVTAQPPCIIHIITCVVWRCLRDAASGAVQVDVHVMLLLQVQEMLEEATDPLLDSAAALL